MWLSVGSFATVRGPPANLLNEVSNCCKWDSGCQILCTRRRMLFQVELHGCFELRVHGLISASEVCLFYGPPPLEDVLENGCQEALVSDIDPVAKHLHAKSRMSHPTFSLVMVRQQHPPECSGATCTCAVRLFFALCAFFSLICFCTSADANSCLAAANNKTSANIIKMCCQVQSGYLQQTLDVCQSLSYA